MYTLGCKKGNQEVVALCVLGSDSQGLVSSDIGTRTFGCSRKTADEKKEGVGKPMILWGAILSS